MNRRLPAVLASVFVGAALPMILGTTLTNYVCVYDINGCGPDYSCTSDSGHCGGTSHFKTGAHIVNGNCISRTNSQCIVVENQPCHQEVYYTDSWCENVCAQTTTVVAQACNLPS